MPKEELKLFSYFSQNDNTFLTKSSLIVGEPQCWKTHIQPNLP